MRRSFTATIWLGLALAFSASLAQAHEFWLHPEDFTVAPDTQVRVNLRNGLHMVGVDLPYLPENLPRFEVISGDTVTPITSRVGDLPAITIAALDEGLAIFVTETSDLTVRYEKFDSFQRFADHKAMPEVIAQHRARGLPEAGFVETFRRYAKSLMAVGDGAGSDRAIGLRIEIVALANPYTDDMTNGMPLQVLMDGKPRAMARLAMFETAADGTVTETPYTTDANGQVTVPAKPGATYLADSVDIFALPNNDPAAGPVWHSDWASLTYAVP